MKNYIALLVILGLLQIALSEKTCHLTCGSQSSIGCSDFLAGTNNPNLCYTCAVGFMGGGGNGVATGACVPAQCHKACKACKDESQDLCYTCSAGFYDVINNPATASRCERCHESCAMCGSTLVDGCTICAPGYFDPQENPYVMGLCTKCDPMCSACKGAANKCTACPQGSYSTDEINGGECKSLSESGKQLFFYLAAFLATLLLIFV